MSSTESWQELLTKRTAVPENDLSAGAVDVVEELAPPPDPAQYQPWLLQRGGRPTMFLDLRRIEHRTGEFIGTLLSYPHIVAVDYLGGHMLALDYGVRHYVIEGTGLAELSRRLQTGSVVAIQEFSPKVWTSSPSGSVVSKITVLSQSADRQQGGESSA
jgi:hypothetical protein